MLYFDWDICLRKVFILKICGHIMQYTPVWSFSCAWHTSYPPTLDIFLPVCSLNVLVLAWSSSLLPHHTFLHWDITFSQHYWCPKAGFVPRNVPGGMSVHNSAFMSDYNLFVFPTHAYKNVSSYLPVAHLNRIFEPSFCMQTLPACSAPPLLVVDVKSVITKSFLLYYMYL